MEMNIGLIVNPIVTVGYFSLPLFRSYALAFALSLVQKSEKTAKQDCQSSIHNSNNDAILHKLYLFLVNCQQPVYKFHLHIKVKIFQYLLIRLLHKFHMLPTSIWQPHRLYMDSLPIVLLSFIIRISFYRNHTKYFEWINMAFDTLTRFSFHCHWMIRWNTVGDFARQSFIQSSISVVDIISFSIRQLF